MVSAGCAFQRGTDWLPMGSEPGGLPCGSGVSSAYDTNNETAVGLFWRAQLCRAVGGTWDVAAGLAGPPLETTVPNRATRGNAINDDGANMGEAMGLTNDGTVMWGASYRFDGTAAGTVLASDIAPGGAPSDPSEMAVSGDRLFFAANGNSATGETYEHELWALSIVLDGDGDGVPDGSDCDPADGDLWAVPGEVRDLVLSKEGSVAHLEWQPPEEPGATIPFYDTVRADSPDGFDAAGAVCVESGDGTDTTALDSSLPDPVLYYLVLAGNACGRGTAGTDSGGSERTVANCP